MRSSCITNRTGAGRKPQSPNKPREIGSWTQKQRNCSVSSLAAASPRSGVAGSGVGIGIIFGNYVSAAGRNPAAAPKLFGNVLLGFALTEAIALFALVMAFIILFGS